MVAGAPAHSLGWQRLRRPTGEYVGALVQQLTRQAHLVPAVLAQLQERGEAGAVLRILMPAQARALLVAMLEAHGLPSLPRK